MDNARCEEKSDERRRCDESERHCEKEENQEIEETKENSITFTHYGTKPGNARVPVIDDVRTTAPFPLLLIPGITAFTQDAVPFTLTLSARSQSA